VGHSQLRTLKSLPLLAQKPSLLLAPPLDVQNQPAEPPFLQPWGLILQSLLLGLPKAQAPFSSQYGLEALPSTKHKDKAQ
jgi:hypothetical protein